MPTTTASDAPMLTPRMPGSASGLRVTPCMTRRPARAPRRRARARTVRGIRLTTAAWLDASRWTRRAPATMSDQRDVARADDDRGAAAASNGHERRQRERRPRQPAPGSGREQGHGGLVGGRGEHARRSRRAPRRWTAASGWRAVPSGLVPGSVTIAPFATAGICDSSGSAFEGVDELVVAVGDDDVDVVERVDLLGAERAGELVVGGGRGRDALGRRRGRGPRRTSPGCRARCRS